MTKKSYLFYKVKQIFCFEALNLYLNSNSASFKFQSMKLWDAWKLKSPQLVYQWLVNHTLDTYRWEIVAN